MPEKEKVLYLCDRQACKRAQTHGCNTGNYCKHTTKIEHAINFKQDGGVFVERLGITVKEVLNLSPDTMWYKFEDLNGYTFQLHRKKEFMRELEDIEVVKIDATNGGSIYVKLAEAIK